MKKSLLLLVMTLMGLSTMASPVDSGKAVLVARKFMAQYVKGAGQMEAAVVYTHPMPKTGEPAFYVVNVGSSAFVLVSADDIAHPVLGYSLSRPWPTGSADGSSALPRGEQITLPSQVTAFLDDLASQIEAARQQNITPDHDIASEWSLYLSGSSPMLGEGDPQGGGVCQTPSSSLPDSVGPLLTTTWDQGQYYNALCPEDANGPAGHVPTGCIATAMAQIINYWGYPIHGRGIHSYQSNYGTLSVNYDSATYDYANMPTALTSTSTPQEINAVATLMRDCGVAVQMQYSTGGSGAFGDDVRAAFVNFFRLNSDYAERLYFPDSVWRYMLQENLANNHPVCYLADICRGCDGHAFVCDGYKTDGYFHFNFGWSGMSDGWYTLDAVIGLDYYHRAILNIFPDSSGSDVYAQTSGVSLFNVVEPIHLHPIMGNNAYPIINKASCKNIIEFFSKDTTFQLMLDVISFEDPLTDDEDPLVAIYDYYNLYENTLGNSVAEYHGGTGEKYTPTISSDNTLDIRVKGVTYGGFDLIVRRVKAIRDSIVVCDSYNLGGVDYTTSTTLVDTLSTSDGIDSVAIVHLVVNHSSDNTETVDAIDSIVWNGSTYYESGIYNHNLPFSNASGCDSITQLWLTITHTQVDTITITEDTLFITDTICGWEYENNGMDVNIYADGDQIFIKNMQNHNIQIANDNGELLENVYNELFLMRYVVPSPGHYIVKVDEKLIKRVVVY
ncbi:MAG: C10 family peptidase [Bacteroidales bacterium]|nr:C10 family peptidase [Bacteroidales bacterium]